MICWMGTSAGSSKSAGPCGPTTVTSTDAISALTRRYARVVGALTPNPLSPRGEGEPEESRLAGDAAHAACTRGDDGFRLTNVAVERGLRRAEGGDHILQDRLDFL